MSRLIHFLLPSVIGALFFLFPVYYDGGYTIPIGILADYVTSWAGGVMPALATAAALVSALLTTWYSLLQPPAPADIRWFMVPFIASRRWLLLRVLGLVACVLILFGLGPEMIWSEATGRIMLFDLVPAIIAIFVVASYLLPLLTDFGLMELVGTLLSRVFRRLFTLPGRSCMDALASWMAAASLGIILTTQQYRRGYYSAREAACIATNFSVVSLPFCVVFAEFTGLGHLFVPYYLTICLAGTIAAMIMPRIPPLSLIPAEYSAAGRQVPADPARDSGLFTRGLQAAMAKADSAPGFRALVRAGTANLMEIIFGLLPPVVFIGTVGLIVVEYTPVFTYLSLPFKVLLDWLGVPESAAAAPAFLVGFIDQFLPAVIAAGIESEVTRYIIIVVAISQLIYLTEVGVLILRSGIPLGIGALALIFLLRTAVALPIAVLSARWFASG
jgi:nucleoside recognition membrane protein YjiH